mmetsp:Transcript_6574/g.10042  ORF Transcript_6574/g.10042 Transcript_6574/m.10042 type:complete len:106 (+) Transcript_6574:152-469(+)
MLRNNRRNNNDSNYHGRATKIGTFQPYDTSNNATTQSSRLSTKKSLKLMMFTTILAGLYVSFDIIEKVMGEVAGQIMDHKRHLLCSQGAVWNKLSSFGVVASCAK